MYGSSVAGGLQLQYRPAGGVAIVQYDNNSCAVSFGSVRLCSSVLILSVQATAVLLCSVQPASVRPDSVPVSTVRLCSVLASTC